MMKRHAERVVAARERAFLENSEDPFDMNDLFCHPIARVCPKLFKEPTRSHAETFLSRLCENKTEKALSLGSFHAFLRCVATSPLVFRANQGFCPVRLDLVTRCVVAVWPAFTAFVKEFKSLGHGHQPFLDVLKIATTIDYWGKPEAWDCLESIWNAMFLNVSQGLSREDWEIENMMRMYRSTAYKMFLSKCRDVFFLRKDVRRCEEFLVSVSRNMYNDLRWLYKEYARDPAFVSSLKFPRFYEAMLSDEDFVTPTGSASLVDFLPLLSVKKLELVGDSVVSVGFPFLNEGCRMLRHETLMRLPDTLDVETLDFASPIRLPRFESFGDLMNSLSRFRSLKKIFLNEFFFDDHASVPEGENLERSSQEIMHRFAVGCRASRVPNVQVDITPGGESFRIEIIPQDVDVLLQNVLPCPLR